MLKEGQTLGKYRLVELIRKYEYGEIWQAWHSLGEFKVAIQTFEPTHGWNSDAFLREAIFLAELTHPHILRIYSIDKEKIEDMTMVYLVTEFSTGGTLSDRMKLGPLSSKSVKTLMQQVCSAIDFIHSSGLVHGNLKPQSILFDRHEQVLLTAFDLETLARRVGLSKTENKEDYSAPEISSGYPNQQSDIYALGVILYEMLTGKLPRRSSITNQQVVLEDHLLPEFRLIIETATQSLPANRYASAKEFYEAIEEASRRLPQDTDENLGFKSRVDKAPQVVTSILFLAADPSNASRLRLGEEAREIQEKLQLAKLRDQFQLHQRMSVRPADISQALLDVQPRIVHFSGHGAQSGELCFENSVGEVFPIQPDALSALFEQFSHQIECVLLNACYSETQAIAIGEHIDYVVGMNQAIGDKAAIAFSVGFYQALGAGRTIKESYNLGCVQIRLQGVAEPLTPILIQP